MAAVEKAAGEAARAAAGEGRAQARTLAPAAVGTVTAETGRPRQDNLLAADEETRRRRPRSEVKRERMPSLPLGVLGARTRTLRAFDTEETAHVSRGSTSGLMYTCPPDKMTCAR